MSETSRGLILRLAFRAIRWRAAASATVFVVAVVAILAATVGPIYLHAVDETVLATHLNDASLFQRGVLVSLETQPGFPGFKWVAQVQGLAGQVARDHLFAKPVSEDRADVTFGGAPPAFRGEIASVAGVCGHVQILHGHCLAGAATDETLISQNTAATEHLHVGSTFVQTTANGLRLPLRVAGVYRPIAPAGPFWEPWDLFQFGQPSSGNQPPPADASFVTPAALAQRRQRIPQTLSADVALVPGRAGYDDIGRLRRTIAHVDATVAHLTYAAQATSAPVATVTTSLPLLLDQAENDTSLSATLVTVTTAQLALLAIFVLYAVVANTATAQGPEVALAKLRGRRSASILLQGVAQPVLLVIAAAPVGAFLAWVVVRLLASHLLGHPVTVTFPPAAYGVAALTLVGGVLAALVAAQRILVTPVGALMRLGAPSPGSSTGLLIADATAVTLAVAGLIELEAGGVLDSGKPNPLSVLAPTLLAIAAAVVALRLLPFLIRPVARWTRDSRRVSVFLAVRQLLRRPAEARAVLLVAVPVSIAAFAVTAWADAGHNRSLRALNSAGAHTVLVVRPGAGVHDLRTAVDRADPGGHSMAVAYTNVDQLPPLIAVDTARFASVGAWVPGNSAAALPSVLRRLAGGRPPPVTVTGSRLALHVLLTRHPGSHVALALTFSQPSYERIVRTVAPVRAGAGTYDIALPPACARGCRLVSLSLSSNTPENFYGSTIQVSDIAASLSASVRSQRGWRPVPAFADSSRWRGNGQGPITIGSHVGALSLNLRQSSGSTSWASAVSASIPTSVPAVVASTRAGLYEGSQIHGFIAVGLDGQTLSVNGVIQSVTLPQVDRNGVMVDLGTALAAMTASAASSTQFQVWLGPSAPPDMAARLARQHVFVERTIHSSSYRSALDDSGPAFADSLFLIAALAATVLAIGATAAGRVLSIRRRAYELAALEAIGVAPRALRRATAAEQGSIFGIGLLIGLAAGLVGSGLALPSTPVFVDTSIGPPLVLGLPWSLLVALAVGLVVVFMIASVSIAGLVDRAANPGQLRGAQQ